MENPFLIDEPKPGQFTQLLQISVEHTIYRINQRLVEQSIREIATHIDAVLALKAVTPWIMGGVIGGEWLQDALNNKVHYTGIHDDMVPNPAKMRGEWQVLDLKKGLALV